MSTLQASAAPVAPANPVVAPRGAALGPQWFTTVMGTGIVATAAATLPVGVPGLPTLARGMWLLASALLGAVTVATARHWHDHLDDPVRAHTYGAPPMALMTVGAGALLVGRPLLGTPLAVGLDAVLWTLGTVLGLCVAVAVPYRMITSHAVPPHAASGAWLMPVVPPMVSAATGPLLLPHLPAGQWQLTMQLACTAMFGVSLVAALVVITMVWSRLVHHGIGAAAAVPTLWIVLGPLGQSITAAHALGVTARGVLPAPYDAAVEAMGVVYGVPVWGFAMLWLALVGALTLRTARRGLPFSLAWWSFTFPVGTVVTGTSALAVSTGAQVLTLAAVVLFAGLVATWAVVAFRTARGVLAGRI